MPQEERAHLSGGPIPNDVLADNSKFNSEPSLIVQCDDGLWAIGWCDDAAGPFSSRMDAARIASGYKPAPVPAGKFRRIKMIREVHGHARTA